MERHGAGRGWQPVWLLWWSGALHLVLGAVFAQILPPLGWPLGFGGAAMIVAGFAVGFESWWGALAGAVLAGTTGLVSSALPGMAAFFGFQAVWLDPIVAVVLAFVVALAAVPSGSAAVAALASAAAIARTRRERRAWAEECDRDSRFLG